MPFLDRIRCFETLEIRVHSFSKNYAKIDISLDGKEKFILEYKYDHEVELNENLAGLMGATAIINYALFTGEIIFDFPTSESDRKMIEEMLKINNVEVFINRLCRIRYPFFRNEFLPADEEVTQENANGNTKLTFRSEYVDNYSGSPNGRSAIMLSGGKESLLSYGIMRELTGNALPYFFNESGGHWKAAKHSHDYLSRVTESARVWSNIDRFYNFMNHRMPILDPVVSFSWADDYPVQLFLFPVYLFATLPSLKIKGIKDIIMGNEMDDPAEEPPYKGIRHYYGVYDQSPDFQRRFSKYTQEKGFGITLWSALYDIYGSVVEDILVNRYNDLYLLQRSCHSCRYQNGDVYPCGKCTKCLGVRLFIEYAHGDPEEIHYPLNANLLDMVKKEKMKLDPEELEFLTDGLQSGDYDMNTQITGIHLLPGENEIMEQIPVEYREGIYSIISEYTNGNWKLDNSKWVKY